jgi:kynureninase
MNLSNQEWSRVHQQALLEDANDCIAHMRDFFHIPKVEDKNLIYFCGNSLGLMPKATSNSVSEMLSDWQKYGVEGHFEGSNPWVSYHESFKKHLSILVGAKPNEVVAMNSLTVNMHLLLSAFYTPRAQRKWILTERKNFSSDLYALQSQAKLHGLEPKEVIKFIDFEPNTFLLSHHTIIDQIRTLGSSLSLVWLNPVNYLTGQYLAVDEIIKEAHQVGALVGLDLAHAVGNVALNLHQWEADFAVWCTYKYLNSGPGAVGGAFIHEVHASNQSLNRLSGWWGNKIENRFDMNAEFDATPTADGFQLSNAPVLSMTAHMASLKTIEQAGWELMLEKSRKLSNYLQSMIAQCCINPDAEFEISLISPQNQSQRGAQLSYLVSNNADMLVKKLRDEGIIIDLREKKVIRIAPTALYNTFEEAYHFTRILSQYAVLK